MPRVAQPRKVPRSVYWRRKLEAAPTASARLGEACDFLRAQARRFLTPQQADALMKREADRLEELAKQLGRRTR